MKKSLEIKQLNKEHINCLYGSKNISEVGQELLNKEIKKAKNLLKKIKKYQKDWITFYNKNIFNIKF